MREFIRRDPVFQGDDVIPFLFDHVSPKSEKTQYSRGMIIFLLFPTMFLPISDKTLYSRGMIIFLSFPTMFLPISEKIQYSKGVDVIPFLFDRVSPDF